MTLIYKKNLNKDKEIELEKNFSLIINNGKNDIINNKWFKGSRNRGLR
tara:strand:+ start:176 stop:319 length:144 start_codon:yes stop_codon:yes gene_type:complete